MTKDRVGAGLAILAAVIGLVLVFQFPQAPGDDDDDDDAPAAPPPASQIAPAPGGVLPPGQVQQPQAPAQPQDADGDDGDGDGDDDDG